MIVRRRTGLDPKVRQGQMLRAGNSGMKAALHAGDSRLSGYRGVLIPGRRGYLGWYVFVRHMKMLNRFAGWSFGLKGIGLGLILLAAMTSTVAQQSSVVREYRTGSPGSLDQLSASRLRTELGQLSAGPRERALAWLRGFTFTDQDLVSLHADRDGGIFYVCEVGPVPVRGPVPSGSPVFGAAAVPVSPFPPGLIFHSLPGAPNVLFLNFTGENVTDTIWNDETRAEIPALPFSADADYGTFSDAEQLTIRRIWQRVSEDYAPFDVDVTTERPGTLGPRTAHALITGRTDANGDPNPFSSGGGVAYVNVFGTGTYPHYRPAWIYHDNLGDEESYIAEAASHEVGHNFGLSHDGQTGGSDYYGGHGTGEISWGPLMGTGYNRNVTQWSQGDYYLANNTQDDLAVISAKLPYRTDDHGNTSSAATALVITQETNIVSTTPETDPANTHTANKGVLEQGVDVDVFSFSTGTGAVRINVNPWIVPGGFTRGGNADLWIALYDEAGTPLFSDNPPNQTAAKIQTNLSEGRYYLHIRNSGAGSPLSTPPTGYTSYGSLGQVLYQRLHRVTHSPQLPTHGGGIDHRNYTDGRGGARVHRRLLR